jgi:hypothetical protein
MIVIGYRRIVKIPSSTPPGLSHFSDAASPLCQNNYLGEREQPDKNNCQRQTVLEIDNAPGKSLGCRDGIAADKGNEQPERAQDHSFDRFAL